MQDLPHQYLVSAAADPDDPVIITSENLPRLVSAPPAEFGGPGNQWSPEHLLTAAVADCFVLTFRAVAEASKLAWTGLSVTAEGTLDRQERAMQFTAFTVKASLTVPAEVDPAKAQRALEKAESACLITNSLKAEAHLEAEVTVEG